LARLIPDQQIARLLNRAGRRPPMRAAPPSWGRHPKPFTTAAHQNNWFGGDRRVFAASYALAVERRGGRSAEDPPCSYAPSAMAIHDLGIRDYSSGRKSVWSIRVRLEIARTWRDLALFNLARDSKLRACDLVKLRVDEVCSGAKIRNRATIEERQANRCNSRLRSRRRPPSKFGYGCSGQLALDISSQADFMHAHTYRPGNTPG
jgi:hypothetical protein